MSATLESATVFAAGVGALARVAALALGLGFAPAVNWTLEPAAAAGATARALPASSPESAAVAASAAVLVESAAASALAAALSAAPY